MRYKTRPVYATARRIEIREDVDIGVEGKEDYVSAWPGDWVVTTEDGEVSVMGFSKFNRLYEIDKKEEGE